MVSSDQHTDTTSVIKKPFWIAAQHHTAREMAIKGVRYLCYTHDSGPEDCVRPSEGLGRPENCGTKWGERGKGFFRESQCGSTVAGDARIDAIPDGALYVSGSEHAEVKITGENGTHTIARGETGRIA